MDEDDYDALPVPVGDETKILIADIILNASRAEFSSGILLKTVHRINGGTGRAKGWGDSGEQLLKLLQPHIPDHLYNLYSHALQFRNAVIHGIFINKENHKGRGTGFYILKPERKDGVDLIRGINPFALTHEEMKQMADSFLLIEELIIKEEARIFHEWKQERPNT